MTEEYDFKKKIISDIKARKAAFNILGINESVDAKELKKAYRKAALKYHPDHNGNTVEANRKFILIKCAYELLAYDKPCKKNMEDINSWPDFQENSKYSTNNIWGHFLWWKEKFFNSDQIKGKSNVNKRSSCI